jgi:hypothetical protein
LKLKWDEIVEFIQFKTIGICDNINALF